MYYHALLLAPLIKFYGEAYVQVLLYAAIPFPLYEAPTSGEAVDINFWFFLFVYYGLYNAVGLLWITKLFNLFSVNWWPRNIRGVLVVLSFLVSINISRKHGLPYQKQLGDLDLE